MKLLMVLSVEVMSASASEGSASLIQVCVCYLSEVDLMMLIELSFAISINPHHRLTWLLLSTLTVCSFQGVCLSS